jgi:hypothetical protein
MRYIGITNMPVVELKTKDDMIVSIYPPYSFGEEQDCTIYLSQLTNSTQCVPSGNCK